VYVETLAKEIKMAQPAPKVSIEITPETASHAEIIMAEIRKWNLAVMNIVVEALRAVGGTIELILTSLGGKTPESLYEIIRERICRFCRAQCSCPQLHS
jgi:hypothetical protein